MLSNTKSILTVVIYKINAMPVKSKLLAKKNRVFIIIIKLTNMGLKKLKSTKPISVIFYLQVQDDQEYIQQEYQIPFLFQNLEYLNILEVKKRFIQKHSILYEHYMYYPDSQNKMILIDKHFSIAFSIVQQQYNGNFVVIIQSYAKIIRNELQLEIQALRQEIRLLHSVVSDLKKIKQNYCPKKRRTLFQDNPKLKKRTQSQSRQLDIGVFFSQPIYDEAKNKPAKQPVDFRSELQRMHAALKSSPLEQITLKFERATIQNMKLLLTHMKPNILHIISHGTKDGNLQFQDDSSMNLGYLRLVSVSDMEDIFKDIQNYLPKIVFVNTCYSQKIGRSFFKLGVENVVIIDSMDSIEDQAAQIFSQNFYRKLFKGQKVNKAFQSAKKQVELKHNSFTCCCNHSSQQPHSQQCLWIELKSKIGRQNAHRLYHVPSNQCKCQLKNYNRHALDCKWALRTLFSINKDFRIMEDESNQYRLPKKNQIAHLLFNQNQLMICCCLRQGKIPHCQSHKFKLLQKQENNEAIYKIISTSSPNVNVLDLTSNELLQFSNTMPISIFGRQEQLYYFLKQLRSGFQNIIVVYGISGVGKTTFVRKAVRYAFQRYIYQQTYYLDLFEITNRALFNFRFAQLIGCKYQNQFVTNNLKNKKVAIILDNCDQFYNKEKNQFRDLLNQLKVCILKAKIIVIFNKDTFLSFQLEDIYTQKFELPTFNINPAAQMLYFKLRHKLDLKVQYSNLLNLVKNKEEARSPEIIEDICQSFNKKKGNICLAMLQDKIEKIGIGDSAAHNLILQNLDKLKQESLQAYELLLFIAQFSEGLNINDFQMFSTADSKGNLLNIPIKKNWQQHFRYLFGYKNKKEDKPQVATQPQSMQLRPQQIFSRGEYSIPINSEQQINGEQKGNLQISKYVIDHQSYFLERVSLSRFSVKQFIRQYIQKKINNETTFHIKFILVSFLSLVLEKVFYNLKQNNWIHQTILSYTCLSKAGIFNESMEVSMDQTIQNDSNRQFLSYTSKIEGEFEKIMLENKKMSKSIQSKDPSLFLTLHKQNLLNIYSFNWQKFYSILSFSNQQEMVFLFYFEQLLLYIPTALKLIKSQSSLIQYTIKSSMKLLTIFRHKSDLNRNLKLLMKLQLFDLQEKITHDKLKKQELEHVFEQIQNTISSQQSSFKTDKFQELKNNILFQKTFLQLYMLSKQLNKDISFKVQTFKDAINQDWTKAQIVLTAKKNLLLAGMFLDILKDQKWICSTIVANIMVQKMKKDYYDRILNSLKQAEDLFTEKNMMKLQLKSMLCKSEIMWQLVNDESKLKILSKRQQKSMLKEVDELVRFCQKIYYKSSNHLGAITQFQSKIQKLTLDIQEKMWQQSKNLIVFMKASPLWFYDSQNSIYEPIVKNLCRTTNNFKIQIEETLKELIIRNSKSDSQVKQGANHTSLSTRRRSNTNSSNPNSTYFSLDISTKFSALSRKNLVKQLKSGCSIMILETNCKIQSLQKNIVISFQGRYLQKEFILVDETFFSEFNFKGIQLLVICGENSKLFIELMSQYCDQTPVLIALDENQRPLVQLEDSDEAIYQQFLHEGRKQTTITMYICQLLKRIKYHEIKTIQQIQEFHKTAAQLIKERNSLTAHIITSKVKQVSLCYRQGTYVDRSPCKTTLQNIDSANCCIYRRWQLYRSMITIIINKQKMKQPFYFNVFGNRSSGKTFFVRQLAQLLIQRQFFDKSGVFIFEGKQIASMNNDFEHYIKNLNQEDKLININHFYETQSNMLLIIEDFHLIRIKINGSYHRFLKQIVRKNVSVIVTTNQSRIYQELFKDVKLIRIQKLKDFEQNILLYGFLKKQDDIKRVNLKKNSSLLKCWKSHPTQIRQLVSEVTPEIYEKLQQQCSKLQLQKNMHSLN